MSYRNPLAWDRSIRPGMFKSDENASLPRPEEYVEETPSQLDVDLRLARDYEEIDRKNAELEALYAQSQMPPIISTVIPYRHAHLITEESETRREVYNEL